MTRPSDDRRTALRSRDNTIKNVVLNNLCPIERYYGTADKVLEAFLSAYERVDLDEAYILGMRFASFSSELLPTHDYYRSSIRNLRQLRDKNIEDLNVVLDALEDIVKLMDEEEMLKAEMEVRERERRAKEKILKKREQAKKDKEREERLLQEKLMNWNLAYPKENKSAVVEDATSLVEFPNHVEPTSTSTFIPITTKAHESILPPPLPPPAYDQVMQPPQPFEPAHPVAPPEPVSPPPPPPYSHVVQGNKNAVADSLTSMPGTSSYLANMYPTCFDSISSSGSSFAQVSSVKPTPLKEDVPSIYDLKKECESKYKKYTQTKKVEIFTLETHQGRLTTNGRDTTNGCTVIAPLTAIQHLNCPSNLPDAAIETIIDAEAPPILSAVRSKLGLSADALIVPSDVHDYLVDIGILSQDRFVGVCGGNILDDKHLGELLKMLDNQEHMSPSTSSSSSSDWIEVAPSRTKKVAAALFFHEHVISILKIVLRKNECWFDIVDSMPRKDTSTTNNKNGNKYSGASRIRCKDINALQTTLHWYAFSKFTSENLKYIESNYQWDDTLCDFDPRVFQAFVWSE